MQTATPPAGAPMQTAPPPEAAPKEAGWNEQMKVSDANQWVESTKNQEMALQVGSDMMDPKNNQASLGQAAVTSAAQYLPFKISVLFVWSAVLAFLILSICNAAGALKISQLGWVTSFLYLSITFMDLLKERLIALTDNNMRCLRVPGRQALMMTRDFNLFFMWIPIAYLTGHKSTFRRITSELFLGLSLLLLGLVNPSDLVPTESNICVANATGYCNANNTFVPIGTPNFGGNNAASFACSLADEDKLQPITVEQCLSDAMDRIWQPEDPRSKPTCDAYRQAGEMCYPKCGCSFQGQLTELETLALETWPDTTTDSSTSVAVNCAIDAHCEEICSFDDISRLEPDTMETCLAGWYNDGRSRVPEGYTPSCEDFEEAAALCVPTCACGYEDVRAFIMDLAVGAFGENSTADVQCSLNLHCGESVTAPRKSYPTLAYVLLSIGIAASIPAAILCLSGEIMHKHNEEEMQNNGYFSRKQINMDTGGKSIAFKLLKLFGFMKVPDANPNSVLPVAGSKFGLGIELDDDDDDDATGATLTDLDNTIECDENDPDAIPVHFQVEKEVETMSDSIKTPNPKGFRALLLPFVAIAAAFFSLMCYYMLDHDWYHATDLLEEHEDQGFGTDTSGNALEGFNAEFNVTIVRDQDDFWFRGVTNATGTERIWDMTSNAATAARFLMVYAWVLTAHIAATAFVDLDLMERVGKIKKRKKAAPKDSMEWKTRKGLTESEFQEVLKNPTGLLEGLVTSLQCKYLNPLLFLTAIVANLAKYGVLVRGALFFSFEKDKGFIWPIVILEAIIITLLVSTFYFVSAKITILNPQLRSDLVTAIRYRKKVETKELPVPNYISLAPLFSMDPSNPNGGVKPMPGIIATDELGQGFVPNKPSGQDPRFFVPLHPPKDPRDDLSMAGGTSTPGVPLQPRSMMSATSRLSAVQADMGMLFNPNPSSPGGRLGPAGPPPPGYP